ncbi:hypothetical protein [Hungatella hathewayi]|uniref:hypothetical protein n=1 Tax=Hungatella hathewayi TaxID=154046 RepID=UPI00033BA953|nr:hypothetical protein [Hungatella hathewayi]CCZ63040.1 putative uncharacterized protein [Hungatella hathewayi CAG:224]
MTDTNAWEHGASSWLIREPNLQCHIKGVIISHSHVDHFFQGLKAGEARHE